VSGDEMKYLTSQGKKIGAFVVAPVSFMLGLNILLPSV
jgi:hypothetical protein